MTISSTKDLANWPVVRFADRFWKTSTPRTRLIVGTWLLFFLLVALGIHGSSSAITAGWWMPEKPYTGFVFGLSPQSDQNASKMDFKGRQELLQATPRIFRWDEAFVGTPYALSQLAQHPSFPVINPSFGLGQNMLINVHTPVWHIAALSRPATWGYFFLGPQRGLTWYWWFQPMACFTALFLLLEILLRGDWKLAAFGALLFGTSAYVVAWSLWADYLVFFAALACLSTYHLCQSENRRTLLVCAILLGLSLPGFVMTMYPPWQVPVAYLSLILFAGLFIRDKLHLSIKVQFSYRLLVFGLAVALAVSLTLAWFATCRSALNIMANTLYPGRRMSTGGDYSLALLFQGVYNAVTCYLSFPALKNESESASFYYFFPAVFFALPLSKKLARGLGAVGWLLVAYICGMIFFLMVGVPESIASVTLLRFVPSDRAALSIGLASIILSLYALHILRSPDGEETSRLSRWMPWLASGGVVILFIIHSLQLLKMVGSFPHPQFGLLMACLMGLISYFLLSGKVRTFAMLLMMLQLATTLTLNPLSTNLDHIYKSELAQAITLLDKASPDRPFWVTYGSVHVGQLIAMLGGRSLTGIQWPPQLPVWRSFDPDGRNEFAYNRYAEVSFDYTSDDNTVTFSNPQEGTLIVKVSPTNSVLKELGTRYVILMGDAQKAADTSRLKLAYRSSFDNFSIYEIP